ncbi:PAQR family membrane homeostasis protein TrhA [Halomonas sp. H5]|uniref:PAQR family membrane homeostasis protein TrhA n=1 Tax=Halomonas sp. H5 TaxID=3423910 RepID=UPI003D363F63
MGTLPVKFSREQSRSEEIANSLSHGAGIVAALVGVPILLMHAARHGDTAFLVGTSLFSAAIFLLYSSSTIYHALPAGKAKRVFRVLDHCLIYLLIAGTYTPFTLGVLRGAWGWTLFGVIWGLASVGVALKASGKASNPIFSTTLYLLMGWIVVIALEPLVARVPTPGLHWLLAGGLSYTAGVLFFAIGSKLRYGHLIWHCFVLAGTACHYFAVLWYAA